MRRKKRKQNWALDGLTMELPKSDWIAFARQRRNLFLWILFASIFWLKKRGLMPGLTF